MSTTQDLERLIALQKGQEQASCPHIAGCNKLSECWNMSERTSIVWHTLRTRETVGICTVCQRHFRENDFDYALWRSKPSFNWGSSDKSENPANKIARPPHYYWGKEHELDKLSDAEIKFLFEGVQAYRKAQKALQQHFGSEVWSVR